MPEAVVSDLDVGYYVYGVVAAQGSFPELKGIDDVPVEYVEGDGIAAAVAPISLDRPPGRRAELVAHSAVVDALAAAGPVVPVQFGSVLEDRDSVVSDLLEPEQERFRELLENLRGTAQFNLRATYVEEQVLAEVVRDSPEIRELRRRTRDLPEGAVHPDLVRLGELVSRALEHKRAEDADDLLDTVLPLVVADAPRRGGGVDHLLDVALLVETGRIPEFEDALEQLAEGVHERIRLRLTGPVAPYDFVQEDRWD